MLLAFLLLPDKQVTTTCFQYILCMSHETKLTKNFFKKFILQQRQSLSDLLSNYISNYLFKYYMLLKCIYNIYLFIILEVEKEKLLDSNWTLPPEYRMRRRRSSGDLPISSDSQGKGDFLPPISEQIDEAISDGKFTLIQVLSTNI